MLDKMRAALNDKNLTIEALVESGREKDRLFLQLQGMCPDQQAAQVTAQLAHVQEVKDQVVRLQNELQNKEGQYLAGNGFDNLCVAQLIHKRLIDFDCEILILLDINSFVHVSASSHKPRSWF